MCGSKRTPEHERQCFASEANPDGQIGSLKFRHVVDGHQREGRDGEDLKPKLLVLFLSIRLE